ncbi:sugar phosphate isomerase/epimerase [Paenibacillus sp. OV219]|uniref:sugar phosphate isomerase/epimerase family protein n=1 Tax=Paenibacillus sp. OV219 TaxID=1884377 RepID=UPI0008C72AEC|nr:sugar phosphate isomerase/epimerase [Paenibacillus sp. OV219]SEM56755.1 Sugar phosphate isomerase/epimerase [Paenibacillus sp. OV219]
MKLGLSSFTLTWSVGVPGYEMPCEPLTAEDLIQLTHSRGLRLLQLADNLPLHSKTEAELEHIKQTAETYEIAIEVGTRGTEPSNLLAYLAIAQTFGSPIVRTIITTPDLAAAELQLREVLPAYEGAGIALAIENHGMHTTRQLVQLFESIASTYVGCCLDTVNSFGALENPETVIDRLVPYLVNLHIKDFDIKRVDHQMGYTILGTPAGAGKLNIGYLMDRIAQHGKGAASAILELWTPYTASVADTIALEQRWMDESIAGLTNSGYFREDGVNHYGISNAERESV